MQTIGQNIARLRKAKGLTQEKLAEAFGVTAQAVSKWENDLSYPDIVLLKPLARTFGVSVDELLDDGEGPVTMLSEVAPSTEKMFLRVRVLGEKEKVNINVPVKLIELFVGNESLVQQMDGGGAKWMKSVDFKQILQMISFGVVGKLVEIEVEDGERVEIWVE